METNLSLFELVMLNLYLGTVVYLFGIIYQLVIIYRNKDISRTLFKVLRLLLITLICSIVFSLVIWKFWIFKVDIMFGPILLPALISETVLSPLILSFFGYRIFKK